MSRKLRIAIGQISSESNHFTPAWPKLDFLKRSGYLHEGERVLELAESDTEVGGFIAACRSAENVELVPLLATRAVRARPLRRLLWLPADADARRLSAGGPVDGVLISHHGSMTVESRMIPKGIWSPRSARSLAQGPARTNAGYARQHHLSSRRKCNVIVGYEHYPHDDARRTGERAVDLVLRTIAGQIDPRMAGAAADAAPGFNASTLSDGPFARLMNQAKALESEPGILSTSLFLSVRISTCRDGQQHLGDL